MRPNLCLWEDTKKEICDSGRRAGWENIDGPHVAWRLGFSASS